MDLQKFYSEEKEKMNKSIDHLKQQMSKVHTGRAVPALLDGVVVNYYGTNTPLKQLCNIAIPEPRTMVLHPYDKNALIEIEKAISASNLGLNPQNDGKIVRLVFPMLSEERREESVKLVKKLGEETKTSLRNIRHQFINEVKKRQKDGDVSEDELYWAQEEVQKITDKHVESVDEVVKKKEEEVRKV